MSSPHEPNALERYHRNHDRKMSRRRDSAKKKKPYSFQPDFHDLELRRMLTTFVVINANDQGLGSLRQAIIDSNTAGGSNNIAFNIPDNSSNPETYVIALTSGPLPVITDQLAVDGTTETAFLGKPAVVEIDGSGLAGTPNGLNLSTGSDGSDISGLEVLDFGGVGILVQSANNTIGGMAAGAGNLISGNATYGVQITGASATGNAVEGNLIGTDITGTVAMANGKGVAIDTGAAGNTIGGLTATPGTGAGNVISGNTGNGVGIIGSGTTGNVVAGNIIGLNAAGTSAIANGDNGVEIDTPASYNTIGGVTASARNIISGAGMNGVGIFGSAAIGNVVQGDYIGTNLAGTAPVGNASYGIESAGTSGVFGGATDDGHGNPSPGAAPGNLISGNPTDVVLLGTSDVVAGNLIGLNATGTAPLFPETFYGILVAGADNTIGGLSPNDRNIITGAYIVVAIQGDGNQVLNNYVGTDPTGTIGLEHVGQSGINGFGDMEVSSAGPGTVIGAPGAGNLLADSWQHNAGYALTVVDTPGIVIQGNKIGTNAAGTAALPNGGGISIGNSDGFQIGGTATGAGNLISGNQYNAIIVGGTTGGTIEGNEIGTDVTGEFAIPNSTQPGNPAVDLSSGVSDVTIGGTTAAARNVISGNDDVGILIGGAGTTGNVVEGDYIGTDITGTVAIANVTGVEIDTGASGNTIGGLTATPGTGAGNVISGNTSNGVEITGSGTTGNLVAGNIVGLNAAGTESIIGDVAWYKFDGNPYDSVGSYTANVTGFGGYVAGKVGQGILMNGAGEAATSLTVNYSTGATFDAWFQTSAANGTIAADDGGIATQTGMGLFVEGGDLVLSGGNGSGTFNFAITGPSVDDGAFHHVAATWTGDTTTDGVKLYLDGVLVGQTTASSSIATGSQTFAMGNGFTGVLDEVNVVDRPLAASEVARIDNAGSQGQGLGNRNDGVDIDSAASNNTIGGATASARNIIGGNWKDGVVIGATGGATAVGNIVQGDYIGTDLAGTTPVGNSLYGILSYGTSGLVGGATDDGHGNPSPGAAPGNLIAGSITDVSLFGTSDVVAGNLIGLNATGTAPLFPGTVDCIQANGADNIIGGLSPNDRNIITGAFVVVAIGGDGNQVLNNYVGTDSTGTIALEHIGQSGGSGWNDIFVNGAGPGTAIGAPGAGNVVVDSYVGDSGIGVADSPGVVIQGNTIGTNAAGTAALPNGSGIYIEGSDGFQIGGAVAGAGNLISGNSENAVAIRDTTGGAIQGNDIGTDITGEHAIPNGADGGPIVFFENAVSDVTIGGTTAAARNVISGNDFEAIKIGTGRPASLFFGSPFAGAVDQGNVVEGNYIGVKADGSGALPNLGDGIDVANSALDTVIGGTIAGAANVISGNTGNGVLIDGTGVPGFTPLYLKADGNTNNTAYIYGFSSTNITIVGGVTYGTGVTGQAFQFNGTAGERVVVSNGYLNADALTLSAWINLSSLPGATPYVIASRAYSATSENYGLYVNSSGELVLEWYSAGAFHTVTSSGAALGSRLGVFQQVAVVTDGSTVTFYVNGAAVSSAAMPDPLDGTAAGPLEIGGLSQGPNLFNGLIDELSVTLNPLAADEIARIYANAGAGTDLGGSGTEDTTVVGNFIGTNPTGTTAIPNGADGVEINDALNNTIGSTTAGAMNVISGNSANGVEIAGSHATGNIVEGDFIGTDITGTVAIANVTGVELDTGASGNTIGGLTATPGTGAGNVISGNNLDGIYVLQSSGNLVEGNLIGTEFSGSAPLGNAYDGIRLESSSNDTVGGTTAATRNVISASGQFNLYLVGASDETVQGNYIGTDATGAFALDTSTYIDVSISSSSDNLIGGTAPGAGNVISGAYIGVNVSDYSFNNPETTVGNTIQGNLVGLNASGTAAVPNGDGGIDVGVSKDTEIGGTAAGAGNVVSGTLTASSVPGFDDPVGSDGAGIYVEGPAPGTAILDNRIGTNESGTDAVPNQGSGVFVLNSTATINGNQIAGNGHDGITVQGDSAPSGLAGLWSADGTTFDGYNTDGTLLGGATYAPGISGQAFSFDGISGAFQDNSIYTPPSGRILYPFGATMEAWINTTHSSGTVMTDGGGIDTQSGMGLFLQNGQLVAIGSKGTAGQFNFELTSPGTVNDGQWHLVAVTWNGTTSAGGVTLYVDGVAVATGTALATLGNLVSGNNGASSLLYFGGDPNLPLPYYKGLIDEVGVYSAALSASDVATIYSLRGLAQSTGAATITGNLIGTNAAGTAALPNSNDGVDLVGSSFNTIGGTTPGMGNVISGNTADGLEMSGVETTANVVAGNFIGTDLTGTVAIANGGDGVEIDNGASGNTIGGTTGAPSNVISGNTTYGVEISGSGTSGNVVEGDYIGTDITGTVAIANGTGVELDTGASSNTIGGSTAGAGNVISGNESYGVYITASTGNVVAGNLVGTNASGSAAIPNTYGVFLNVGASSNLVGTSGQDGAAADALERNVISGNSAWGVTVVHASMDNVIAGNYIGTNAAGTAALANGSLGAYIGAGSQGNWIGVNPVYGPETSDQRNIISGNGQDGVIISGTLTSGNTVAGNYVGTDITGTVAVPNYAGVYLQNGANHNLIGSNGDGVNDALERNIISGNSFAGVWITGLGTDNRTDNNVVAGNYIGTDVSGTVAIANGTGVEIDSGASGNTIGGFTALAGTGAGNVISGNTLAGVEIGTVPVDTGTSNNVVAGNLIGTDATGENALPNLTYGVLSNGVGTTIGGTAAGALNVISANPQGNVVITGGGTTNDLVAGNDIGLDRTGATTVGSVGGNVTVETPGNTIGGTTAAARNVISGASSVGISLDYSSATGNLIEGNYIGTDASGTSALANYYFGIWEQNGAVGNTIGGTVAGAGNLVVGQIVPGTGTYAMVLTSDNLVAGNLIDSNPTGTAVISGTAYGITFGGSNNTIGGTVAAARNILPTDGIWLQGNAQHNLVEGNISGLDITGTIKLSSNSGIEVDGPNNTIGGTVAGAANVLAGLSASGENGELVLNGPTSTGNLVEGNLIGTDITGTVSIRTGRFDLIIGFGATNNTIGGTTPGARNVISSGSYGLLIDSTSPGNLVEGNFIGTDITGTQSLSNSVGILVATGSNTIGGTSAGAGNVVSGNAGSPGDPDNGYGIWLTSTNATGNLVEGNLIGLDATGEHLLGNTTNAGVYIYGAPNNTIGGTTPGAGNVISGNFRGIFITLASATGDVVEGNLIGTDQAGTIAIGNTHEGILITLAQSNTIGGTAPGAGNVISSSGTYGLDITDTASDNLVAGNFIGTNATGTAALGNAIDGVIIAAASNTIGGTTPGSGNLISGNVNGVEINDASLNLVQGNLIGTDTTGTLALGNTGAGVLVDAGSSSNTIGGPVGGARNLISGNAEGVVVTGAATTGTVVAGNLIGTDINGTSRVGNLTAGVSVSGASGTTIGGATILARNIISANAGDGVDVNNGATDTLIQGNYVGADQTGTQPLGNAGDGISVNDAAGITIGGTAQAAVNVISANVQAGVSIQGSASTGVAILGNFIGTDYTGTSALGNGTFGVVVGDPPGVTIGGTVAGSGNIISGNTGAGVGLVADATGELVEGNLIGTDITGSNPLGNGTGVLIDGGSYNNTIGGSAGAGNTIAFSTGIGVDVDATAGAGNDIRLNSIFSDGGLGIDLGGDGVTLNNSVPHTGPNDHQNFPVITSAITSGGVTTVTGTFNSTLSTTFELDFYTLSSMNASGYGEGRYVLGSAPLTTGGSGNANFSFAFPTPSDGAKFVTATATDPNGNTSEFSKESGTDTPPTAVISFTSITVNEGVPITFDGSQSTDPEGNGLTYSWTFGDGGTGSGVTAIHTYRTQGIATVKETVELTVNDGFGGISTATATVIVNDAPPVFVPESYTPPVTYTTPTPGDGFGEGVASVDGNAAIGARFANVVYLYDGNPTDVGGVSSTYVYGQFIHVFADPNPAPGDEFGASIAAVGNDLLVGAPGSSLTGPGDGVAYLFDANPDSLTFGKLLVTLTIPDADASHHGEFGASVSSANTNVLIGAPGKNHGTGEVYVFQGDVTQPTFGNLLLDISNPDAQAGAEFGAAVAGIGSNVIVGAPADNTAGTGTGTVYLFNGTTGAETASIVNPRPLVSTKFGSAVASVGPNILIGSPDDNTASPGAGAAFLFGPSGALLQTFVQPDGGGGHFGASVAGTGTTALIGAPGATLGTNDAGAAYLFDANPTSSTFGRPIDAEQEPKPVSGGAFGTAVGFDLAGLLIGAAGADGTGVQGDETVNIYQPGIPLSVSSSTTYATAAPHDSVIVSGTFTDPGGFVPLTASINWGDGSAPTLVNLPAGSFAFAVPHDYTNNSVARDSIGVTLDDGDLESAFAQTVVAISDPAPVFAPPGLVLSSSSIAEGSAVTVSGTIVSPGGIDINTVSLNWGDGFQPTTIVLAPGVLTFSTSHTYLNNPAGVASKQYAINASVTNEYYKVGFASASVTVNKVAPQFTAADLHLSKSIANEGDTITLGGRFTDPDALSSYTVTIDWGDGSTPTVLLELLGQVVQSATPGLYTYSTTHQYLDNPPGELTGGSYDIHVSVSDGVNITSADTSIVVNNVPPTVQILSSVNLGTGMITVTADVTDPGILDIETVAWTLTQNGIGIGTAAGTSYTFTIPNPIGVLVATATATDSDGGVGSDSAQMVIIYQTGASVVINPSGITVSMGGTPVSTTTSAGAGQVAALITGSNDLVDASAETNPVQLVSTGSNETLIGGAGNDLLVAGPGANSLVGGAGDDTLVSNLGDDTLVGGSGNDVFRINPGKDPLVVGSSGFNTLDFSIAALAITLNLALESGQTQIVDSNNDEVTLEGQFDGYIASPNGDKVTANSDNDLIYGGAGNTTITGGSGNDSIVGGTGNDIIYGGSGNTTITGGSGGDSIVGGTGNDIIYGGSGNTTITGGSGGDSIVGGTGNDIIYGGSGNTTITGGSGGDSIVGGTGNDIIYGGSGNTTITGGSGGDSIVGGTGNDIIYGGPNSGTLTGGSGGDSIVGGTGNDIIYGGGTNNTITGGSGNDSIVGGTGNDIIYGGSGNTTITGGSGGDSIVGGTGNDIIYGGRN